MYDGCLIDPRIHAPRYSSTSRPITHEINRVFNLRDDPNDIKPIDRMLPVTYVRMFLLITTWQMWTDFEYVVILFC